MPRPRNTSPPRRHDPIGQSQCAPALAFGEPEEGAKTLRVIVDRDPAAVAGVPARDRLVYIGNPNRSQGNTTFVQPVEETIDRAAATTNRVFGPPALFTHPCREDRDRAGVGMLRFAGFFEQADEAQPSYCVAEESLTCLRQRGPAAPTPAGQRPLPGRGLDLGHIHSIAFVQIEKMNQAGLMNRNLAQCGRPSPILRTMSEVVAQPFLKQRCGVILGYRAAVDEQILEHDRISLLLET